MILGGIRLPIASQMERLTLTHHQEMEMERQRPSQIRRLPCAYPLCLYDDGYDEEKKKKKEEKEKKNERTAAALFGRSLVKRMEELVIGRPSTYGPKKEKGRREKKALQLREAASWSLPGQLLPRYGGKKKKRKSPTPIW